MNEADKAWLAENCDVISEYELRSGEWEELKINKIGGHTDKGVFVNEGNFMPFSQAKVDFEGNVYVRSWLLAKW